jgi:putative pyruvate formate lyase activating enzyme
MSSIYPRYLNLVADGQLEKRADLAVDVLADCALCPRACHVDRLEADVESYCGTGQYAYVSSFFPHQGEEPCLRGRDGSGTIFFSRCSLRCVFCQNYDISWQGHGGPVAPDELARMMLSLQSAGCHNINLVTPTHVVPQILQALALAAGQGLRLPIVYNSSGYDRVDTLRLLDGIVDIYMPDFKFWDPESGMLFARAEDYREVACAAIAEMHRQVGDMVLDDEGLAHHGLLVRHLVMPDGQAGTRDVMRFLAKEISPQTMVNIMDQYRPAAHAHRYPSISRSTTRQEYEEAMAIAKEEGLSRFA